MKRFTQKFFLLAMGLMLSMGASAQNAIHHRFPEVKFLYNNKEYILPAWDVMFGTSPDESKQRVQAKESWTPNSGATVTAKIVSRFGITADEEFFTSFGGSKSAMIQIAKVDGQNNPVLDEEGNIVYNEFSVGTVTYAQACPNYDFSQTSATGYNSSGDGDQKLFFPTGYTLPTGEYTITTEKVFKKVTFEIDEIGAWAYRGQKSGTDFILLKAQKVIIPKEITTIGIGAFSYIMSKEIEFADDSEITSLSRAIFMCSDLEKITLPASITKFRGASLGGLESIQKITFKGTTVPELMSDDFEPNTDKACTCDPFTPIKRLSTYVLKRDRCVVEVPLGSAKTFAANAEFVKFPMSSKFPVTASSGMMSYCSDMDFTFKQYNTDDPTSWGAAPVKVYYVKDTDVDVDNGKVLLTEISDQNADTQNKLVPGWAEGNDFGVVIKGTSGETYDIFFPNGKGGMTEKLTMDGTDNCLHGCVERTLIDVENEDYEFTSFFVLSGGTFHRVMTNGYCKENRAYIMVADGGYGGSIGTDPSDPDGGARELVISFPEDTGIESHEVKNVQNDAWYTLQGIQVNQPSKGIFIKNGKKYIVK